MYPVKKLNWFVYLLIRFNILVLLIRSEIKSFHTFFFLPSHMHRSSPSLHQITSTKWLTPSFFNMHLWRNPGRAKMLCMLTKMIHKYTTDFLFTLLAKFDNNANVFFCKFNYVIRSLRMTRQLAKNSIPVTFKWTLKTVSISWLLFIFQWRHWSKIFVSMNMGWCMYQETQK